MNKKKVLIVGAGGFAGGFIVAEGLKRGYEIWAGIRESTSKIYLQDENINFVVFDFSSPDTILTTLRQALPEDQKWDWIIYNLGATKALTFSDFSKINYEYLRNFIEALKECGKMPEKFLYMSSLSVMGPGDEKNYTSFTEGMIPRPNTRYGASKLKAEMLLEMEGVPYIIFRPTGIYGPRDKDYFLMFQSVARGVDFGAGYRRQMLTFIYVEDLAEAVYDALEMAPVKQKYIISEDAAYSQQEFRKLSAEALGKKLVVPFVLPLWAVKAVSAVAEKWGVARMKPSTLNSDKFNIMKQRNWKADISKARHDFNFNPKTSLKEGIKKSVEWYRKEGWL